jgi:hypothetical protein
MFSRALLATPRTSSSVLYAVVLLRDSLCESLRDSDETTILNGRSGVDGSDPCKSAGLPDEDVPKEVLMADTGGDGGILGTAVHGSDVAASPAGWALEGTSMGTAADCEPAL